VITKFIEAVSADDGAYGNHGKFAVACFEPHEWGVPSIIDIEQGHITSLVARCGWTTEHFFVLDLQTGEGALFKLGGYAKADLDKHAVWVCPLFEPFLEWLYEQYNLFTADGLGGLEFFEALPTRVQFERPVEWAGYRRPGPDDLTGKVQFLVDWIHEHGLLEESDGFDPGLTFPDGDTWYPTKETND
jgi:hypothetical protein